MGEERQMETRGQPEGDDGKKDIMGRTFAALLLDEAVAPSHPKDVSVDGHGIHTKAKAEHDRRRLWPYSRQRHKPGSRFEQSHCSEALECEVSGSGTDCF